MKDFVFLCDYEAFLKHRAFVHQSTIDEIKETMRQNQEDYEKTFSYTFLYKKLGWKSFAKVAYDTFDEIFYDLHDAESRLRDINREITKMRYIRKSWEIQMCENIDTMVVECQFPIRFFEWAEKEKRP